MKKICIAQFFFCGRIDDRPVERNGILIFNRTEATLKTFVQGEKTRRAQKDFEVILSKEELRKKVYKHLDKLAPELCSFETVVKGSVLVNSDGVYLLKEVPTEIYSDLDYYAYRLNKVGMS